MQYEIYILNDTNTPGGHVLATVPYTEHNAQSALERAYDIAEHIAKRMFLNDCELREIKQDIEKLDAYPMYFADKATGNTINVRG